MFAEVRFSMLLFCNILTGCLYDSLGPFLVPWSSNNVEMLSFWCLVKSDRPKICLYVFVWFLGCSWNPLNPLKQYKTIKKHEKPKNTHNPKFLHVFLVILGHLARYWIYIQRQQGCAMTMASVPLGGWFLVAPCLSGLRPIPNWSAKTIRLGDREPEIDQVSHYNTITQGQEERIPKT